MSASDKAKLDGLNGATSSTSNKFTEQVTLSGGFRANSTSNLLNSATVNASSASINVQLAVISGIPTFTGDPMFTGKPDFVGGFTSNFTSIELKNASVDAITATINAQQASINAFNATIRGNPLFSDGAKFNDAAFRGNPTFTGKPKLNGGFTSNSVASDLNYSSIDAYYSSIDAYYSSIMASGATIAGYPNFTAGFESDGQIRIHNSAYFDGEVTLQGGFGVNTSATSYLNRSKLDASQASINAANATIGANNASITGRPIFGDGLQAGSVQSNLMHSTLRAENSLIDASYATISNNPNFTGNPTFSGNPTFTGTVKFNEPIALANTGGTSDTAILSFDVSNGLPRLKLRKLGVDYIFNCDTSITGSG